MNSHRIIALIVIGFCYLYALFGSADRFSMTPFREGQTAITAQYMAMGESPFLAYQIPVKGAPWAVPMEFPLFQWLASLSGVSDPDLLRWVGRLMSLFFWAGCLWLAAALAKLSPLDARDRFWFLLILASAPVYIAYSSAFLIETFVLFFSLAYLLFSLRLLEQVRLKNLITAVVCGLLAALVKPTTWASFAGVILLIVAFQMIGIIFENGKRRINIVKQGALVVLLVGLPLVAGLTWVSYADAIKLNNPLTLGLTSEALSKWNYGGLSQKLSFATWLVIVSKQALLTLGASGALLLPIAALSTVPKIISLLKKRSWQLPLWLLLATAGYLSAPIVFTNLHYRHDYYMLANGFFLVALLAMVMALWTERFSSRVKEKAFLVMVLGSCLVGVFYLGLKKSFVVPQEDILMSAIETLPEGPVVFYGFGWSSKMPYELQRRAMMFTGSDPSDTLMHEALANNAELPWVAIAVGSTRQTLAAEAAASSLGGGFNYRHELWPGMELWSRYPYPDYKDLDLEPPLLKRIQSKLSGRNSTDSGILYFHSLFSREPKGESFLEVMLRRGNDLFYIETTSMQFYCIRNYF